MSQIKEKLNPDSQSQSITADHGGFDFYELLRTSVDLLNDAILITEAEPLTGVGPAIVWANNAFYKSTGYTADEVIGRTPRILQGPLSDRSALDRIGASLRNWQPVREEVLNYRKDGSLYWNELEIVPIANEVGWFTHWVSIQRDCTLRREFQKKERERLGALQLIADNVPGLIFQIRLHSNGSWCFAFVSKAAEDILKVEPQRLYENASEALQPIHADDLEELKTSVLASASNMTPWIHEFRTIHPDGTVHWLMGKATPISEPEESILWHGFITDITERHALEDCVRDLAFHDTLTGLPNRRLLGDRIRQALAQAKRTGGGGALMFLDLDNFKALNDIHGHAAGDAVLITVAHRLTSSVRETDTVARLGGDEFVVLLENVDGDESQIFAVITALAEKIRASLEKPHFLHIADGADARAISFVCEASIGVATFNDKKISESDIFHCADVAMYSAKAAGGNQIKFYQSK